MGSGRIAIRKSQLVGGNTTDQRTEGDPDPAPVLRDNRDLLVEKLKIQIARLKRMHFGRSSEKLATEIAQLELALEELEAAQAELPPRLTSIVGERKAPDRSLPPIFRARRSFTCRQAAIAFVRPAAALFAVSVRTRTRRSISSPSSSRSRATFGRSSPAGRARRSCKLQRRRRPLRAVKPASA